MREVGQLAKQWEKLSLPQGVSQSPPRGGELDATMGENLSPSRGESLSLPQGGSLSPPPGVSLTKYPIEDLKDLGSLRSFEEKFANLTTVHAPLYGRWSHDLRRRCKDLDLHDHSRMGIRIELPDGIGP